jgi:ATPase subunit of ABC transporter with duplicated ATPase domains
MFLFFRNELKASFNDQIIFFITFGMRILPSLSRLQPAVTNYAYYKNSLKKINNELETKKTKAKVLEANNFVIKLESCDYSVGNKKILNNISYTFNANNNYLILGDSGSGKTSLIKLILGLIEQKKGSVYYNKNYMNDTSLDCSYVSQHPMIFDDSVLNNLTLFRDVDKDRLKLALDISGINFNLNGNAISLSGGEKKRLSLARAIYFNSQIIILDEIDSGLDIESTRKLYNKILTQCKYKLLIAISHKNLDNFSNIIRVVEGEIA